jgi:hypothetical protein
MNTKLIQLLTWVITALKGWTTPLIATAKSEAISEAATYTDTEVAVKLQDAKDYADAQDSTLQSTLESYADTKSGAARQAAQDYADTEMAAKLQEAKDYSDVSEVDAIAAAKSYTDAEITDLDASLKSYTDQAETDAVSSANNYTDGVVATNLSTAQGYADTVSAGAQTAAENYANGLFADAQVLIGGNSHLVVHTLTSADNNTAIADLLTARSTDLQEGKNAMKFVVADDSEFAITGIASGSINVGHLDMLFFDWDGSVATNFVFADDRTSQAVAQVTFDLAAVKTGLIAAFPEITFPS